MMQVSCGMDLVEIRRIEKALINHGERFKNTVYTANEIILCDSKGKSAFQSYAARFCGKEAVSKALGTGIAKGVNPLDIEILNLENGKPTVTLYNEAKRIYDEMGGKSIDISLTHTHDYAAAQVIIAMNAI